MRSVKLNNVSLLSRLGNPDSNPILDGCLGGQIWVHSPSSFHAYIIVYPVHITTRTSNIHSRYTFPIPYEIGYNKVLFKYEHFPHECVAPESLLLPARNVSILGNPQVT